LGKNIGKPYIGIVQKLKFPNNSNTGRNVPERQTVDYIRHGTTTLFATLDVLSGNVIGECKERHTFYENYYSFFKETILAFDLVDFVVLSDFTDSAIFDRIIGSFEKIG